MTSKEKELKNVVRRESYFSTLAKKEAKGARDRARAEKREGMIESAKDSHFEMLVDQQWEEKRKKLVQKAKEKLKDKK